jgi:hypothetical protein
LKQPRLLADDRLALGNDLRGQGGWLKTKALQAGHQQDSFATGEGEVIAI